MVVESSWVSVMTVKCLWNDRKPFFDWIFGRFLSHHPFHLIFLASWVQCFLLDILLGLYMFTYNRIFISRCCSSLSFSFFYIENTKILGILHCWHLIFWVLIIDLSTCIERLHLIWNCRTILKISFWKAYHLLGIKAGMILGDKFCSWANFPWFFQKTRFAILKMIRPNSIG